MWQGIWEVAICASTPYGFLYVLLQQRFCFATTEILSCYSRDFVLLQVFRSFTNSPTELCTCPPDKQWEHWVAQGSIEESMWTTRLLGPATSWVDALRHSSCHLSCEPSVSYNEANNSRKDIKHGKSPGKDGIPSTAVKQLPSLTLLMHLLFSVMLQFGVYPVDWGIAIVRGLLKPGKPKNEASSLRGIRFLSSLAPWFGRIVDKRARKAWQPGPEQFGFRSEVGCAEAVALLIALILTYTTKNKRLCVL